MKQNYNILIIGGVLLLALVAFSFYSNGDLSVVGNGAEMIPETTCEVAQDCYNELLSMGFPKSQLDEQLQTTELLCINNQCGVSQ